MAVKPNIWLISILGQTYSLSPYILLNGIGLIVGLFLIDSVLTKKLPDYQNVLYVAFVLSIVAGWAGAYFFNWLISNTSLLQSGFTFYGGLIGGLIFYIFFSYKYCDLKIIWISLNAAVIPLLIAHAIGRVGCFFAGCCYGLPVAKDNLVNLFFDIHPTQLYESFFLFSLALFLFKVEKKHPLSLVYFYFIAYGVFRFLIEFLRGDPRIFFYGLSTSQWISLIFVFTTIGFVIYKRWRYKI